MNMLLKSVAGILIILGIVFCSMGIPYQGDMFWYGPYEKVTKSESRKQTRFAILGLVLIGAGIGLLKLGDVPD